VLTPTDVHLLVGLLTQASSAENVKVELGSLIYDSAAEKLRDVDITVAQTVGEIESLKGLEVKRHTQPLDVTHVEQLVLKLEDMPALTSRQIVSASGYTSAAVKKATAHNVELFRLTDWDKKYSFQHARFNETSSSCSRSLEYVAGPHLHIEVESYGKEFAKADPSHIKVVDRQGAPHVWDVTFREFQNNLIVNTTNELQSRDEVSLLAPSVGRRIDITIGLADDPHLQCGELITKIKGARLQGIIRWKETPHPVQYKILVNEATHQPVIGCMLAELPNGNLVGITASNADRTIRFIHVGVSARNLSVIRKMQLGRL
jgi:hypothetical protein